MVKRNMLILLITLCTLVSAQEKVLVKEVVKSTQSWDGDALPAYEPGEPEVTLLHITIPPKTKLPLHHHTCINVGYLLKGELTVFTEKNDSLHLQAGDPIVEVVNTLHFGVNNGDIPAEIIVWYAGIKDQSNTVKE